MANKLEALCVVGGDTEVKPKTWVADKDEAVFMIGSEEVTVSQGMCVRPSSCALAIYCTGKVTFSSNDETGFSQVIVQEVHFKEGFNVDIIHFDQG